MKHCPDCARTLPLAAFTKNRRTKDGLCVYCRECMATRNKVYRDKDREAFVEKQRAWRERNRDVLNMYALFKHYADQEARNVKTREYYKRNREKMIAYQHLYRAVNSERLTAYRRERYPEIRDRAIHTAKLRKRMLSHRMFSHEKEGLLEFYRNCPEGYHVDHIVPLTHPLVCGLHVLANLQYLPAVENLKKRNKFEV